MNESSEDEREPSSLSECRICLGEHDEALHAATLKVLMWFRWQVIKHFDEEVVEEVAEQVCVA